MTGRTGLLEFHHGLLLQLPQLLRGEVDGDQQSTPFREWFGKLGEVRSLVQCPLLLITATASKASRLKMQKIFCMKNCFEKFKSPDRTNIKLFLHKFKSSQDVTKIFAFMIIELLEKKEEKCDRYLVFCTSIKSCSEIYTMLHLELESDIQFVQMYHSMTVKNVKEDIKQDLGNKDGKIRLLVATSAAGMGVNFKDIGQVIIFGVPKNMDSFIVQWTAV
ncbi:ATP-dependent DNA helicase RecQ-like [Ruditapes philippinarum]|uniref:ATP-dependent DNA helicase RecQ-like n=1 Tax=Ruditapes philippinarum TaxID=129788 RepID=UPI00295C13EB|nr:ATP-dependent DNA helicase RecQ-like [Ruditapes philippinarum]